MYGRYKDSMEWWVERNERCKPVEVFFEYTPEDPGCHTMRNGDPGWPGSDSELEILDVKVRGRSVLKFLTEKELDILAEECLEEFEYNQKSGYWRDEE